MKTLSSYVGMGLLALALTGCAGTNFVRVQDDALSLGKTTSEDIARRLGTPYRQGAMTKNNEQTKTLVYSYATAGGEAMEKGVTPARSQGFYFLDNKLVGYEFTSSYKVDNTNFDSALVSKITKGVSTRDDVARSLGQAGGRYIYPLIPSKEEDAVNYLYGETRGSAFNLKFHQKLLVVTFNTAGFVTNVEFSELGQ